MDAIVIAFAAGSLFGAIGSYFFPSRDTEELPDLADHDRAEAAPTPPPRTFTNLTHRERTLA